MIKPWCIDGHARKERKLRTQVVGSARRESAPFKIYFGGWPRGLKARTKLALEWPTLGSGQERMPSRCRRARRSWLASVLDTGWEMLGYRRTIEALRELTVKSAYIDAELCALNAAGVPT